MAKIKLKKHIPKEQLERLYRKEKCPRTKERLWAIKLYYEGRKTKEIASILGWSERTLGRWKKKWNNRGLEELRYRQGKGGGPEPRLSKKEWEKIAEVAIAEGMDCKEVAVYVKNEYEVEYSHKTTWKKLRKDLGISFGKPYILNKKRPENAEEVLKKVKGSKGGYK